jgi:hypothetical protein
LAWAEFDAWNESLVQEFLTGRFAHRPVYLDVDPETLATIAPTTALNPEEARNALVEAVRPTLALEPNAVPVFSRHRERLLRWVEAGRQDEPPFVALLAMFALIAEEMHEDREFGGANYFGRLCKALAVGRANGRLGEKLIRGFRTESHLFWDAYNQWLTDAEGVHGLPTAYAFDHRRHVGRAISQVLLRETDRNRLLDLFRAYRLRPGQRLAVPDMKRIMAEWLPVSRLSARTKGLWARGEEVRDRIAAVTVIELELWSGEASEGEEHEAPSGRLRLIGLLRRFPGTKRLELTVKVPASQRLPEGEYRLSADATGPVVEALRDCAGSIHLLRGVEGWIEIKEVADISLPDLILGPVELTHVGSRAMLRRDPRGLIILLRDQEYRWFEEVERIELATDALLLVHRSFNDELLVVLEQVSRPGFQRFEADQLSGVPYDWVLFADVQVMDLPDSEIRQELRGLIPVSWSQISLGGGLSLRGQQIWHAGRPPEVRVSSLLDRPVEVRLTAEATPGGSRAELVLGSFVRAAAFDLQDKGLTDDDYTITLWEGAGRRARYLLGHTLKLRSAGSAALPPTGAGIHMVHMLDRPGWGTVSASQAVQPASAYARGAMLIGATDGADPGTMLPPPGLPGPATDDRIEDDYEFAGQRASRSGSAPGCLVGGGHHWLIETVIPGTRPRWVDAYCKLCGLEKGFPGYPRWRRDRTSSSPRAAGPEGSKRTGAASGTLSNLVQAAIPNSIGVDFDLLLDSACYVGGGTWSSFERLAAQMDDRPWFPLETARVLSSLGHLDLAFEPSTMRPTAWSIAPTVISYTGPGAAIMSGFRSGSMLSALNDIVGRFDGSVEVHPQEGGPAQVGIEGLQADSLESIAREISGKSGLEVRISRFLPTRLLERTASIREIMAALRPFTVPVGCPTQRFDPHSGQWEPVAGVNGGGAYRFGTRPARYGFLWHEASRELRALAADSRLVKHLAAFESQIPIIAYIPGEHVLLTRLGAQLPGLFERALVLSTGRVPIQRRTGLVTYERVTPSVARWLWLKLMVGGRTESGAGDQ